MDKKRTRRFVPKTANEKRAYTQGVKDTKGKVDRLLKAGFSDQ
jgi:hypothetical protein